MKNVYDDIWWYMTIYDDIWWYMTIYDDMIYDDSWWYMMIYEIYDDIWSYMIDGICSMIYDWWNMKYDIWKDLPNIVF